MWNFFHIFLFLFLFVNGKSHYSQLHWEEEILLSQCFCRDEHSLVWNEVIHKWRLSKYEKIWLIFNPPPVSKQPKKNKIPSNFKNLEHQISHPHCPLYHQPTKNFYSQCINPWKIIFSDYFHQTSFYLSSTFFRTSCYSYVFSCFPFIRKKWT